MRKVTSLLTAFLGQPENLSKPTGVGPAATRVCCHLREEASPPPSADQWCTPTQSCFCNRLVSV